MILQDKNINNIMTKKKIKLDLDLSLFNGRGGRNRTLLRSFGDSYSTDELHPYIKAMLFYYNFIN